ncbi:MAG: ABC transporter substrate-binding protein [Candidatus Rokubacteria bacterium]|nr:ABC transporter substrate-binding protein [Candidatus Rokubacteria bacterium]
MFKKRWFIIASILLAMAGWRDVSWSKEPYHVGVVSFGGGQVEVILGMQEGMKELGYEEGKNIAYTVVDAAGSDEKARAAAEEFLRKKVDVVYAVSTPVTTHVAQVIKNIPIIFNIVSDPVGTGLVRSWRSSGNNLTGCSNYVGQTGPKRLEVLKMMVPDVRRVLVPYDPKNRFSHGAIVILREAANALRIALIEKHVGSKDDVVALMKSIRRGEYDAFFHLGEAKVTAAIDAVIARLNEVKLPSIAHEESFSEKGMLAAYGPSWRVLGKQCAQSLDKALRGERPADIPIQIPTRFDLVINIQTAKAIGITLPREVFTRAEKIIER